MGPDGGWSHTPGDDCDDEDPTEFPGQMWYPDCDDDGYYSSTGIVACDEAEANTKSPCGDGQAPDGGWTHTPGDDCDDEDPDEFPGQMWYPDCDDDGYYSSTGFAACDEAEANTNSPCGDGQPPDGGWSHTPGDDCDDEDPGEFPGQMWYADCDGDGHYRSTGIVACDEAEANASSPCGDGQAPDGGWSHTPGSDCDDEDPTEFPGQMWYADCDGDGYFSDVGIVACNEADANANSPCLDGQAPDGGWSHTQGDDCDDEDPAVNPGAVEICDNLIDDDCDGLVDDDDPDCSPPCGDGFCDYNNGEDPFNCPDDCFIFACWWDCPTQCRGDVNCDGTVNVIDLGLIEARFGACYPEEGYDPCLDVNRDGCIDPYDFIEAQSWFGVDPLPECPQGPLP